MREWKLVVTFDSLEAQVERDPENEFPFDEVSRFVAHMAAEWSLMPEDMINPQLIQWSIASGTVVVFPEVLDQITEPLEWLLFHTIPKKVELTR